MRTFNATSDSDLESVFAGIQQMRIGGLVVSGAPFFLSKRQKVVGLAARFPVPAIYAWREYVLAGGLMGYSTDLHESYRQAAIYAGRILKGEKPADLPVAQPTKFHTAINVKTANALGLAVPSSMLVRADEVIE
jgi:putative ABC transport system substrate-binding protein